MIQDAFLHFVAHYGYAGLFAALVLGIVGIPLPDELLMTFAGFLISKGELRYLVTLVIAFAGSVIGITFSYILGHQFGLPFLEKYGRKIHITPEKLAKAERWFGRFGKFALTFGYFIPGIRHFTALSAGIGKWPYRTFILYAYPGGFVWVFTYVTLGLFLQEHWRTFAETVHRYTGFAAIAILAGGGIGWFVRRRLPGKKA